MSICVKVIRVAPIPLTSTIDLDYLSERESWMGGNSLFYNLIYYQANMMSFPKICAIRGTYFINQTRLFLNYNTSCKISNYSPPSLIDIPMITYRFLQGHLLIFNLLHEAQWLLVFKKKNCLTDYC